MPAALSSMCHPASLMSHAVHAGRMGCPHLRCPSPSGGATALTGASSLPAHPWSAPHQAWQPPGASLWPRQATRGPSLGLTGGSLGWTGGSLGWTNAAIATRLLATLRRKPPLLSFNLYARWSSSVRGGNHEPVIFHTSCERPTGV